MQGFSEEAVLFIFDENRKADIPTAVQRDAELKTVAECYMKSDRPYDVLAYDDENKTAYIRRVRLEMVATPDEEQCTHMYVFSNGFELKATEELEVLVLGQNEILEWKALYQITKDDAVLSIHGLIHLSYTERIGTDYLFEVYADQVPIAIDGIYVKSN